MIRTTEEIDTARAFMHKMVDAGTFAGKALDAMLVLLDVAEQPTDEDLEREASALWPHDGSFMSTDIRARRVKREAYIAGARREGRTNGESCRARDGECAWSECPQKTREQPICILVRREGR